MKLYPKSQIICYFYVSLWFYTQKNIIYTSNKVLAHNIRIIAASRVQDRHSVMLRDFDSFLAKIVTVEHSSKSHFKSNFVPLRITPNPKIGINCMHFWCIELISNYRTITKCKQNLMFWVGWADEHSLPIIVSERISASIQRIPSNFAHIS